MNVCYDNVNMEEFVSNRKDYTRENLRAAGCCMYKLSKS